MNSYLTDCLRQNTQHIHFITYGDEKYESSKKRLVNEANEFGGFQTINAYGKEFVNNRI